MHIIPLKEAIFTVSKMKIFKKFKTLETSTIHFYRLVREIPLQIIINP